MTPLERADALNPSALVPSLPEVAALAEPFRDLEPFDAVRGMSEMIYRRFEYQPGVTDVTTSVAEVVAGGRGVCQDFAHLLIGLCRALEIPARYVSGYIVTSESGAPDRGGGASHAWAEASTPSHGWRGFDPTNNLVANDRYIKIAVGRDYHDVPPTRGTYRGAAVGHLDVAVSTRVLGETLPTNSGVVVILSGAKDPQPVRSQQDADSFVVPPQDDTPSLTRCL